MIENSTEKEQCTHRHRGGQIYTHAHTCADSGGINVHTQTQEA